jgi:hypothetical protein
MHSKVTAVAIFCCRTGNPNDGHKGQQCRGRKSKLAAPATTDGGSAQQTLGQTRQPLPIRGLNAVLVSCLNYCNLHNGSVIKIGLIDCMSKTKDVPDIFCSSRSIFAPGTRSFRCSFVLTETGSMRQLPNTLQFQVIETAAEIGRSPGPDQSTLG